MPGGKEKRRVWALTIDENFCEYSAGQDESSFRCENAGDPGEQAIAKND